MKEKRENIHQLSGSASGARPKDRGYQYQPGWQPPKQDHQPPADNLFPPGLFDDPTPRPSAGERLDLNPHSYLYVPRDRDVGGKKYRAIVDYIPSGSGQEDLEEHEITPGLVLNVSGKKTKLDSISPAQWMAANANILADIIETENVNPLYVTDYLAHTAKIAELAGVFTWKSLFAYNDEYRRKQHKFNFRWGADSPHMIVVKLVPRQQPQVRDDKSKTNNNWKQRDSATKPAGTTCRNYNNKAECNFSPCKHRHVCEWCFKSHPKLDHDLVMKKGGGEGDARQN